MIDTCTTAYEDFSVLIQIILTIVLVVNFFEPILP